ncbi:hypothetical protein Taro_016589 [Colocasia esculenta]|uniref:Uncharacterized protein n=1 Tax=Colocasia esculenta TaxID=4460 RepID=A0A843UWQ9_COLES|nr:hypothetical protein [Colocasia esculenta]
MDWFIISDHMRCTPSLGGLAVVGPTDSLLPVMYTTDQWGPLGFFLRWCTPPVICVASGVYHRTVGPLGFSLRWCTPPLVCVAGGVYHRTVGPTWVLPPVVYNTGGMCGRWCIPLDSGAHLGFSLRWCTPPVICMAGGVYHRTGGPTWGSACRIGSGRFGRIDVDQGKPDSRFA